MNLLKKISALLLTASLLSGLHSAQAAETPEKAYQEYVRKIQDYKLDFHSFSPAIQEQVVDRFIAIMKAKGIAAGDKKLQSLMSEDREVIKRDIYKELENPDSNLSEIFRKVIHDKLIKFTTFKVKDTLIKGGVAYLYLDNGKYIKAFLKDGRWEVDILGGSAEL